jgi:acyl-CoA synthetase (AMP-forming)/AMP-acid ligase II
VLSGNPLRGLTFGDVSRQHRRGRGRAEAVVDGDVRLTYRQLDERANRLADRLVAQGVQPGDRLAWLGQNSFRVLELLIAGGKIGAMVCPVNWRMSVPELTFVLEDLAPRVVLWQEEAMGEVVRELRTAGVAAESLWLQQDGTGPAGYEHFLAGGADRDPQVPVPASDPILVIYTAAFDGRPNGSMLTHEGLLTQDANLFLLAGVANDTVYLSCGPLFHLWTAQFMLATFHAGGKNVFSARAEPRSVLDLIATERCTSGMVLPPTIARIIELNSDGSADLSSFRSVIKDPEWLRMVSPDDSPFGQTIGGYGQTEVTGLIAWASYGGYPGVTTAGRPSPWSIVTIVAADGSEAVPGEVGEVVVGGPLVHAGYWNRKELNDARTGPFGWHTNDLGRIDSDGILSFVGPKTQMIKCGVENIYPAEVEGCIEAIPGVHEAAIIGQPHRELIQSVCAVVVREGSSDLSEADVVAHCRAHLASYKKPHTVEFIDALPRVESGAKDYAALDARFGGGGYPGGATRSQ